MNNSNAQTFTYDVMLSNGEWYWGLPALNENEAMVLAVQLNSAAYGTNTYAVMAINVTPTH